MAGEDLNREDVVYSEKIVTEESEKTEAFDEKAVHNGEEHDEFWLKDSKETKDDIENLEDRALFAAEDGDLDIAIINDLAVTDDDPTLRCVTVRSLVVGIVSIIQRKAAP
jgi:hypothetical protein